MDPLFILKKMATQLLGKMVANINNPSLNMWVNVDRPNRPAGLGIAKCCIHLTQLYS